MSNKPLVKYRQKTKKTKTYQEAENLN